MHRRRSLGEVSVDRSRVGPGLRSPRWAGADTPVHIHRQTQARSCIMHPCTDTSLECTLCGRARATGPVCACSTRALARALRECACASDTLPVSQCVRQERCIALRRCVKASENTRSLGLFARLVLSFSRRRALRGPSLFARRAPSPRLAFPFLRFSHSAERSPPSRPRIPVPSAGDPALRLHRRYREKTSMKNECREALRES